MNVLAAPFLYTMPSELEAFYCFAKFIEESCPLYVQPTLEGVHRGLKVSLNLASTSLSTHIRRICSCSIGVLRSWTQSCTPICGQRTCLRRFTRFHVRCIAGTVWRPTILTLGNVSAILTLCACTPPLDQVLQLWDFLLAFGVHLNVLCVIAQLLLMRDEVMKSSR